MLEADSVRVGLSSWLSKFELGRGSHKLTEMHGQFKASKSFCKGESIYTQGVAFGVEVNRQGESSACAHCLRMLPGIGAMRGLASTSRIMCPFGSRCRDVFCSDLCVERATDKKNGWHLLCCTGEKLNSGNYAFEQFCAATSDTIRLTAIIIARTIDPNSQYSIRDLLRECQTCFPWHTVAARRLVNDVDGVQFSDFAQTHNNLAENFAQAWELISTAWSQNENELVRALMCVLNIDVFSQLAAAFELLFRPVLTDCCFKDDARDARVTNLARMSKIFRPGMFCGNTDIQSAALRFFPEQREPGDDESTRKLSSTRQLFVFSPIFARLSHSCSPNAQLEVEETSNGTSVKLIALQNISNLDYIAVCFVPLSDSISSRRRKVFSQFGFWCQCPRCTWESNLQRGWLGLNASRSLCLQYLEEERFHEAEELARFTMNHVDCPDISHILGQALLGEGKWYDAHKVWHDASSQFPCHASLAELVKKDDAYSEHIFMGSTLASTIHPIPLSGTDIWTSSAAVLSAQMCGNWVNCAENFASNSSWSTRRHYAVPTTDLPLHVIPEILQGWKMLMRSTIRPFLALIAPGIEQNQIKVHDAFIVKYSATQGQRFLPVHTDEGQWSLTLALNDLDEYDGGGTLFESEKLIIRPNIGELVMFRSSTLHAGAPVTRGTRYIIAAFLFVTDE